MIPGLLLASAIVQEPAEPGAVDPATELGIFGALRVTTARIYPDPDSDDVLANLVNGTHWTTREVVIERESWFERGQLVREADRRELERNLRATGLFGEVVVTAVPGEVPGTIDFEVRTRDRLSLIVGGGASLVGNVSGVSLRAGERNFMGLGNSVFFSFSDNSEDEFTGNVTYTNRHLGNSYVRLDVQAGVTEEGELFGMRVRKPLQFLDDRVSWTAFASQVDLEVDYFEGGDSVAEVPERTSNLSADWSLAHGPREARWRTGIAARWSDREYGLAVGPAAPSIDVPGDTTTFFVGGDVGFDHFARFDEVTGLDTLDFVQDLSLGSSIELLVGPSFRDEAGLESETQLAAFLGSRTAFEPFRSTYVTGTASGTLRRDAGRAVGWTASSSLHAYHLARPHTLAFSATFDQVFESENLPIELTLGEDNGLRGYPAREFSGDRRIRLNLEDRFSPGWKLGSLEFGAVGFFDAGWIADPDQGLGEPYRSAGIGLRMGGKEIFGGSVLRFDLAFPFDDIPGGADDWQFSVALGQVFSFFGNQANLSTR